MVLSLVNPTGPEFIKDFPFQNEQNCDAIDEFAGPCLTTHSLNSYTPVLGATTTNPTLGAGTVRGKYFRIFDQIYVWGEFRFGTGFTAGSGIYTMNLPFPAKTIMGSNVLLGSAPIIGGGTSWDASASTGRHPLAVYLRTDSLVQFVLRTASGLVARECTNANPVIWEVNDGITWCARYQRQA